VRGCSCWCVAGCEVEASVRGGKSCSAKIMSTCGVLHVRGGFANCFVVVAAGSKVVVRCLSLSAYAVAVAVKTGQSKCRGISHFNSVTLILSAMCCS